MNMIFYTVDRSRTLSSGQQIELRSRRGGFQDSVVSLLFDGVSRHGDKYLYMDRTDSVEKDAMIELVFEYVRRDVSPDRPSRYQSMFGWQTIEQAMAFMARDKKTADQPIYRVKSDIYFKCDMNLLSCKDTAILTSERAIKYWKGEPGSDAPCWEWLLRCPVQILDRVV